MRSEIHLYKGLKIPYELSRFSDKLKLAKETVVYILHVWQTLRTFTTC